MIVIGRTVRYWWFDAETTQKIVETIQRQGKGACLRLTPREDADGEIKLDWAVPVEGSAVTEGNGDPPGGNDSFMCPPVC